MKAPGDSSHWIVGARHVTVWGVHTGTSGITKPHAMQSRPNRKQMLSMCSSHACAQWDTQPLLLTHPRLRLSKLMAKYFCQGCLILLLVPLTPKDFRWLLPAKIKLFNLVGSLVNIWIFLEFNEFHVNLRFLCYKCMPSEYAYIKLAI